MAFTGTPVVEPVADNLARITGLSLASAASGTISLFEGTGQVKLPDSMNWKPYGRFDASGAVVNMIEAVQVSFVFVEAPGDASEIFVTKTGAAPDTFLITMTNGDDSESESAEMEIYVRFH